MTDKITNPEILVKKAKDILKNVTPLKSDCGKMCGKLCCKGPDEKGMRLFPGEKIPYFAAVIAKGPTDRFHV